MYAIHTNSIAHARTHTYTNIYNKQTNKQNTQTYEHKLSFVPPVGRMAHTSARSDAHCAETAQNTAAPWEPSTHADCASSAAAGADSEWAD